MGEAARAFSLCSGSAPPISSDSGESGALWSIRLGWSAMASRSLGPNWSTTHAS